MSTESKKILLIGTKGYDRAKGGLRLDCVTWDKLSDISNVRDYDVLLIDLLKINMPAEQKKVNWIKFNELLNFHAASDILTHDGEIIVLGDPRFEIPNGRGTQAFLDWTGATFVWSGRPGDTVKSNYFPRFQNYEKHLRKWSYSLAGCNLNKIVFHEKWDLRVIEREGCSAWVKLQAACYNRYHHSLAFCIEHKIGTKYQIHVDFGRIYFLPEISLDEDETLQIILRDFCDAASELPEPEWVSSFNVPGQKQIDEKITQIQTTLAEQQAALEKATAERIAVRSCLKLLYEREFALEPAVRDILRQLGATVEDPIEKNKEDGWITVKIGETTYEGVLEIKSAKTDQFNEDGRKQLLDWIDRGRTLRNKNFKGIFIGNNAVVKPLKERTNAFSDSWKKAAELSRICAMKSEELYFIYLLHKNGRVKLDDFWTRLFSTDGIFDIKPLLPKKENEH